MKPRFAFVCLLSSLLPLHADPDTFLWNNGVAASGDWYGAGAWTPTASARAYPEAGDTATIPGDSQTTCQITLSGNAAVGNINCGRTDFLSAGSPATLTLDNGGAASVFNPTHSMYFGTQGETDLALALANPVTLQVENSYSADNNTRRTIRVYLYSKITGGTAEAPCDITFSKNGTDWTSGNFFIANADNDFRGDITLAGPSGGNSSIDLLVGFGGTAEDSMLGDPANVIHLNPRTTLDWHRDATIGLRRRVEGNGTVKGCTYDTQYNWFKGYDLLLGDGCVLAPSAGASPYGKMSVTTHGTNNSKGKLTIHANATFLFDVSNANGDSFSITTANGLDLTGKIVVNEQETITPGTAWTFFTIAAGAGSVAWNPSEIPENYAFKLDGNNTDGWTVTATKLKPGAAVQNLAVDGIGETNAIVHADVLNLAPTGDATLRVYYGTTDGGENPAAWQQVATYPATVTALGVYDTPITGLTLGETYYVRHSVENTLGENFSLDVVSFTTIATATPDVFTWRSTNDVWSAPDPMWTTDTPRARKVPGYAGDKIRIQPGGNAWNDNTGASRAITVDRDVSVGNIDIQNGNGCTVSFVAPGAPATLTFDSGSATATNLVYNNGLLPNLDFGTAGGDNLTVALAQPLCIRFGSAYDHNAHLYAPVTGGSADWPFALHFDTPGNEWTHVYAYLLNPANSFVGDILVGSFPSSNQATTELRIGTDSIPTQDGMLGAAGNRLVMGYRATVRYYASNEAPAEVHRAILGTGTVACSKALSLGADAVLAPASPAGSEFDTIMVSAATLTTDPATTFAVDWSTEEGATACDAFQFNVTSALTLNGRVEVTPQPEAAIPVGERRAFATVAASAGTFSSKLKGPGFVVKTEGNSENGWTLYLEKVPESTTILVR